MKTLVGIVTFCMYVVKMENNESEFTLTILTNSNGFNKLSKYFLTKYKNQFCYETVIRYNNKATDRIDSFRNRNDRKMLQNKTYRVLIQDNVVISPQVFQKYVVPEQKGIYFSEKSTHHQHRIIFQEKTTLEKISDVVPFTLENDKIILIQCTWKNSIEKNIHKDEFQSIVLDNINDTDKSFVPSFGQTRACIYNVQKTDLRLSIGKGFNFGGTQEGRRPINQYYYLEFEQENVDKKCSKHPYSMKQFVEKALNLIPSTILEYIITVQNKTTYMDYGRRLRDLFQQNYIRNFTHNFEKFTSKTISDTNNLLRNVYVAPKWNGIRGIGIWENDVVLIKTTRCLREFHVKSQCLQPLLVQVEMLIDPNDIIINDQIVITEIMGVFICCKNQIYGFNQITDLPIKYNFHLPDTNATDHNTFSSLNPLYSMELISIFHRHDPLVFTYYKKWTNISILKDIVHMKTNWNFELPHHQIDGYLAIVVYDEGKNSLYMKLKPQHTIELEYNFENKTLHTLNNNSDLLSLSDIQIENFNANELYWYNTCLDSNRIIVEFEIRPINTLINTIPKDSQMVFLLKFVKLVFKKIRYDKFTPDSDTKIKNILFNVLH